MAVNRRHAGASEPATGFAGVARQLASVGRDFHARGWALGTSGNFSAVVSDNPLRLAITRTGLDKGLLRPQHILEVDDEGHVVPVRSTSSNDAPQHRPSEEVKLHLAIVRARRAKAVLHTHSVWSTILSERHAAEGGLSIEGYEMLKGLEGVRTHQHRAWLPIIENSQDTAALATTVEQTLAKHAEAHGFLLRRHGLYTWGENLATAKRHVEILEFLLEVVGRSAGADRSRAIAAGHT